MPLLPPAAVGPLAGVAASAVWAVSSLMFADAGRKLGAAPVNTLRILAAVPLLALLCLVLGGPVVPELRAQQAILLALSGVVGLGLGDLALFQAFVDIGPRLATLVAATAPLLAALLGRLFLGEVLALTSLGGMALALAGIAWVVLERAPSTEIRAEHRARGVLLAFAAAAAQAIGLLLSKRGMGHGWLPRAAFLAPQLAALTRMVAAALVVVPLALWLRRVARANPAATAPTSTLTHRRALGYIAAGAVLGPCVGMFLSLVATDRAPLGVAQTACSLTPVLILPLAIWLGRERVSARAILGALVAVAGVALLCLPRR